ncbi:MAG: hypothetical protein A2W98_13265 [Bacteroidetes bacterium GWF2_33_38]|nr:MAG: hypothetical protein A2W98_13265 [Bacteroidetes bacterium GWF2_33_38]OFY72043.1 MAG: hypothetical protein A2265_03000 [Bacteroidetes bacterium RIFOXYA12_FULL_33_9]OFY86619.1 MAG: hypothetical protein A2236_07875 [Bacteroidetes bacterium RIFOXYA2_FULL_33_7]
MLLWTFVFFTLIQLYFYLVKYLRFVIFKPKRYAEHKEPVSVIICAKNEVENLKKNLHLILTQNYPDFEVIVVNDCSSDSTEMFLAEMKAKYSNLRVTTIIEDERFPHGKKLALTIGIKGAKNEILLMTDADCHPKSQNWIANIQRNFTPEIDIVLGFGRYSQHSGFVNSLIRFDTLLIALQYFSYALARVPYMGVGRNLAYRKSLFFKHKGFASHIKYLSGDDDLFINEAATKSNTAIEFSLDSHTISEPKKTLNEWFVQKRRHLSTGESYKFKHKFLLGLEYISRIFFFLMLIVLIITQINIIGITLSIFLFKTILQLIIIKLAMKRLNEKDLLLTSPAFDIFLPLLNFGLVISNYFISKKNRWK